ncbi:MAG: hypothetical protein HFI86_05365 [Bacilli bacterium]|nr:hypothetical protein [Bacilli bacterium]MCI9434678.1 hypothetical protein [Bacilli bacterium]
MNKLQKISILILLTIIFTGCDVEYNLTIDNKKRVIEEVTFLEDNSNMLKYAGSIDEFLYDREQESFYDTNYVYERVYNDNQSGLNVKNSYSSIKNYVDSKLYKSLFESANIIEDKKFYSFSTFGDYYRNNVFSTPLEAVYRYKIDKITVNIKFYNIVNSHNADKVDEENNIYTWYLKSSDLTKKIEFNLSDKVRSDIMIQSALSKNKVAIIISLIVITILIITIIKFNNVRKQNNRI